MIGIVKVISTSLDKLKRLTVKSLFMGSVEGGHGDTRDAINAAPYGIDSNPINDTRALYCTTTTKGKYYTFAYINQGSKSLPGETRIFSTDTNGQLQAYMWLKNAGNIMELNGNDNWAVKYTETKAELDKLKSTLDTLVTKWNSFCGSYAPGSPSSVGTPPTLSTSTVPANTSNFSLIKNDKIQTNS